VKEKNKIEEILKDAEKEMLEFENLSKELNLEELKDILGLTIKYDDSNKTITFLCMLSAYSNSNQFNVSFRAPSSTGKSYIPIELAELFDPEDVIMIAYASPTSFFHETGYWDEEKKAIVVNFERKILIFLDQPHDLLLQRLRPFLSHDRKELLLKVTDRREKHGLRTKSVILKGFASVIFCTGSLRIDEQEATRNFLLSPETSQEKIREAILLKAFKKGNKGAYLEWLENDPRRRALKERIRIIKEANINDIIIPEPEKIAQRFIEMQGGKLKPRHQRDIERLMCLIGAWALLNFWNRKKDEQNNIYANEKDIEVGFKIWQEVAICQELGLPPYVYRVFEEVIKPVFLEINKNRKEEDYTGISRKDVLRKYYEVYNKFLEDWRLRQEILPSLETAGLIYQEQNPSNRREKLIFINLPHTLSHYIDNPPHSHSLYSSLEMKNNIVSETVGGNKSETQDLNSLTNEEKYFLKKVNETHDIEEAKLFLTEVLKINKKKADRIAEDLINRGMIFETKPNFFVTNVEF